MNTLGHQIMNERGYDCSNMRRNHTWDKSPIVVLETGGEKLVFLVGFGSFPS
jgi:hypothetical protein